MNFVESHAVHAMLSLSRPLPSPSLHPPPLQPSPLSLPCYPAPLPTRNASESTTLTSNSPQHSPLPTKEEPFVKPPPKMSLQTLLTSDNPPPPKPQLPSITQLAATLPPPLTQATQRAHQAQQPASSRPKTRILKRPYKKYYSNPTPSSHCHVCARTSKAVQFAICARIHQGLCRKVTCYKCFVKFGWDWHAAISDPEWVCVHCRGECPEGRSQCFIYARVNSRRGSKRKRTMQQQPQHQQQQQQHYRHVDTFQQPLHHLQHEGADGNAVSPLSQPYVHHGMGMMVPNMLPTRSTPYRA